VGGSAFTSGFSMELTTVPVALATVSVTLPVVSAALPKAEGCFTLSASPTGDPAGKVLGISLEDSKTILACAKVFVRAPLYILSSPFSSSNSPSHHDLRGSKLVWPVGRCLLARFFDRVLSNANKSMAAERMPAATLASPVYHEDVYLLNQCFVSLLAYREGAYLDGTIPIEIDIRDLFLDFLGSRTARPVRSISLI
jgi:hypothetical protein